MKKNLLLAVLIGTPLALAVIMALLLDYKNPQLASDIYITGLLGILAVAYLYSDKDLRKGLQEDGKLPRKTVIRIIASAVLIIVAYLAWHFIKEATRL